MKPKLQAAPPQAKADVSALGLELSWLASVSCSLSKLSLKHLSLSNPKKLKLKLSLAWKLVLTRLIKLRPVNLHAEFLAHSPESIEVKVVNKLAWVALLEGF